jgi:hypothetical protein
MPAHACSLVWRGTFERGCFGCTRLAACLEYTKEARLVLGVNKKVFVDILGIKFLWSSEILGADKAGESCDCLRGDSVLLICENQFFPDSPPRSVNFFGATRQKACVKESICVCFRWASDLGTGFWFRGVQPRTSTR